MKRLDKKIIDKLELVYDKNELKIVEKGFLTPNSTVFRINTLKDDYDVLENFKWYGYELEKVPYMENAYKIIKEWTLKIALMKSFKKWYIYIQGITSQIPVELIDLPEDVSEFKVLDLTAAPGGKTTQISARMNNRWTIIANEKNSIRLEKLKYTVDKQGATNVQIVRFDANNLAKQFGENMFDVVIADLPCSAEWRINLEKEKSYKYLEKEWINKRNYKSQQEILKNTISLLKTWGQLIYSTCTIDPLENEWIVHFILSHFSEMEVSDISEYFDRDLLKDISKQWIKNYKKQIFRNEVKNTFRILPSESTEWFFVAKFIKK